MQKQEQGKKDVATTRAGLSAWQKDPNSKAGKAFASAMTKTFGKGALSSGNISRLTGALNNLDKFYNDPGTAKGGQYDVHIAPGYGNGAAITVT